MILGNIRNLDQDAAHLPPGVCKALRFLGEHDAGVLEPGRYEIDGDDLFVLVQRYVSRNITACRPEAHARYLDIQYVHRGCEHMGYIPFSPSLTVAEDALAERDVRFFNVAEGETRVVLAAGDYAVLYPTDVHRPGCAVAAPADVIKLVFKIRFNGTC